ncbi:phosphoribosylanthranilate isomerase [Flexibacter flexilis DSM 6793]|uniref:N-(5'-phosphoribosyl)anthranilate isomerase n=2 Tax=Flexibacter flexilis TaxID=998 RepID=A0A1I1FCW9_9BACT|nr:phosphoribosylanthranilate isomerase [Flexibacter flexilis DSM 6793]
MREADNIKNVANIQYISYLGFIFYPKSSRYVGADWPKETLVSVPNAVQKVGVFVNESTENVISILQKYCLNIAQLHGEETPAQCDQIRAAGFGVWKAFSLDNNFDFEQLAAYAPHVDCFVFDAKGAHYGGNGHTFDWQVLKKYKLNTPFLLSGGLNPDNFGQAVTQAATLPQMVGLDLNSGFEHSPALKNTEALAAAFTTFSGQ